MEKPIKGDQTKRRGRPATRRGAMVSSRFPSPVVAAVDDWALANDAFGWPAGRDRADDHYEAKTVGGRASCSRAKELATEAIEKMIDPAAPLEE